jgi:DNA polymerase family A
LYFQSAAALAEQLFVPLHYTEEWLAAHKLLYNYFHSWAGEQKGIGELRGWSKLAWSGRLRFCRESNAKGSGESTGIMAVNALIQSTGADICKYAMIKCQPVLRKYPGVELIGQVHDELVYEGPGNLTLDLANSKFKNGVLTKPKWIVPESVTEWALALKVAMEEAETEILGGVLEGCVGDPAVSMWWGK